eukprot:CAMPEP_0170511226 /NCGR_PEP_ID=MMETSP0208-20121228/66187_1 /TAXON_ID=197538 /ORGANISM="Strombidium inclinatum, Strain S3" /LENGTH=375 /DNA_ID=CAMNT_0010794751 /DNA_START=6273 /DNA_END=7397 /DNA_ORIENTATION=+
MKFKREAFFGKMCRVMYQAFGLDEENQTRNLVRKEEEVFDAWRLWARKKQENRALVASASEAREARVRAAVFAFLKKRVAKRIALLRVKKVLLHRLRNTFVEARVSTEQMGLTNKIGLYVLNHFESKTKKRILSEWSELVGKDLELKAFSQKRALRIKAECFIEIKQRLVHKLMQRRHQMAILDHFSAGSAENLHRFSKLFLLLSFQYKEQDEGLGKLFGVEDPRKYKGLYQSEGVSSIGLTQVSAESGARVCQTVLAKYVFDKWRLLLRQMKEKRRKRIVASLFLSRTLQAKALKSWSDRTKYKAKKREILMAGDELYHEQLMKRALRVLLEYGEVRKNKRQLTGIGSEFRQIKEEQTKHKILLTWFNLSLRQP